MRLEDAKPGDVLVSEDGMPWRRLDGDAEFWGETGPWVSWCANGDVLARATSVFGPFRRATAADLECIPVEQRPALPVVLPVDVRLSGVSEARAAIDRLRARMAEGIVPLTSVRWSVDASDRVSQQWVRVDHAGRTIGEVRHGATLLHEYRRLAAGDLLPRAIAHERALTPTELAALGRKPLAPADPLGWEVE